MKRKVVGLSARVFQWTDKRTGVRRLAFNLFVEGQARDTVGLKVWQIFVDDSFPCFKDVADAINEGRSKQYLGIVCDVQYNEFGFLEDIEFSLKKSS